jgi:hypothetical protein
LEGLKSSVIFYAHLDTTITFLHQNANVFTYSTEQYIKVQYSTHEGLHY